MNTPTTTPDDTSSGRLRRRKRPDKRAAARRFWRDWWVEIVVGVLLFLAVFLLVEQMNIRETLLAWSRQRLDDVGDLAAAMARAVVDRIRHVTLSDLTAYSLILVVAALLIWRTRERLTGSLRWTALQCPVCGSELHRIHRTWLDRVINLYVPVRRYQCRDHHCRWRGLRVHRPRHG